MTEQLSIVQRGSSKNKKERKKCNAQNNKVRREKGNERHGTAPTKKEEEKRKTIKETNHTCESYSKTLEETNYSK